MEPNRDPPHFWSPSSPPLIHRRRSSSLRIVSLPVLIVLLPIIALIILFFAICLLLSILSQLFRPSSVKNSWDSFNVFLVLFAIICGVFVRRKDDVPTAADVGNGGSSEQRTDGVDGVKVNGETEFPQQWYGLAERRFYDPARRTPGTSAVVTTRLRRNSSYPDLRQESPWETVNDANQFRFFDDFEVNRLRSRSFANRTRRTEIEESPAEIKVIPVVSSETNSSPSSNPRPVTQRKSRRLYQEEEEAREVRTNNAEFAKSQSPPPPPPLPPRTVIPPSPVRVRLEEKFGKSGRKKTNVKKEIAMALGLLYRKRKKKQKAINIYEGDHRSISEHQPPPPPPPPPPPSLFRGLFKKSNKNKRVHSESTPPPPPPPPPAPFSSRSTNKKIPMTFPPSPPPPPSSWQRNSTAKRRPPLPAWVSNSSIVNEGIKIGGRTSSVTIPPPSPPPPFRTMTDIESMVGGDTIGSQSSETPRCGSPEPENTVPSAKETTDHPGDEGGGGGVVRVFCPSPDVNIKAANFIARLRDEWRLEKMNSVRERERKVGPRPKSTNNNGPRPNRLIFKNGVVLWRMSKEIGL